MSKDNPWRRAPFHAPVPSTHPVVQFEYFLLDAGTAHGSLRSWCPLMTDASCLTTVTPSHTGILTEAATSALPSGRAVKVQCGFCDLALSGTCSTCVACHTSWHSTCYATGALDPGRGPFREHSILCHGCEYMCRSKGGSRPRETLRIGQILAGLGTAAQQVCELLQDGHAMKDVRNVYTVEVDCDALAYVLRLAQHTGYEAMRPETIHTDLLHESCDVDSLPAVDVLALTLLCNKHSPLQNGHAEQAKDMDDAKTMAITFKCCALLRRKRCAAKFIIMENLVHWLKSNSYREIQHAYQEGGYRQVLLWRCKNDDLGVPEHRSRAIIVLAHESQGALPEESAAYTRTLEKLLLAEKQDSRLDLADVLLPADGNSGDLTLKNCMVSEADLIASRTLSPSEAAKVVTCKALVRSMVGERDSWFTADLRNGGGANQYPNLHLTEGRTPTITSSHCHRGIYCLNRLHERFFLVPELMAARGFSGIPIRVACELFHSQPQGWSRLGWLVGGAVTPVAYRVLLRLLMVMAPMVMAPSLPARPGQVNLRHAFSPQELVVASMAQRFQHKFLVWEGSETYLLRDGMNPNYDCVTTTAADGWKHIHSAELPDAYTQITLPSGVVHVIRRALQSQGVDTALALAYAHSSCAHVKTNMAGKRGTMRGVGFVAQPGTRHRVWDAELNASGNKIGQCHFKGQVSGLITDPDLRKAQKAQRHAYLSYLHNVQHVCNATDAAVAYHMGRAACDRMTTMARSGLTQTASRTYPSVQIGLNPGVTMHLDPGDSCEATWQMVGKQSAMGLPEVRCVLHFEDGDAVVFQAARIWHGMMRVPPEVCLNACYSQYFNGQLARVALRAK